MVGGCSISLLDPWESWEQVETSSTVMTDGMGTCSCMGLGCVGCVSTEENAMEIGMDEEWVVERPLIGSGEDVVGSLWSSSRVNNLGIESRLDVVESSSLMSSLVRTSNCGMELSSGRLGSSVGENCGGNVSRLESNESSSRCMVSLARSGGMGSWSS